MKKTAALLIMILMLWSGVPVGPDRAMAEDQIRIAVNGQDVVFPDALPFMENGRVLVPVRFIAERLGAPVEWEANGLAQTVSIKGPGTITLKIGENRAFINGVEKPLDAAATISNGRTFVPLRFIGELLGASFRWLPQARTVEISNGFATGNTLNGFCYSPFRSGQSPEKGAYPARSEIQEDLTLIAKVSKTIRTYGNKDSQFYIPELAQAAGLDCYAGVWLGRDRSENNKEIARAIKQAGSGLKNIRGFIVGNEVMLREDLTVPELIQYIIEIKDATGLPVGTADTYGSFVSHPEIVENLDFMMIHIHPFWENISASEAPERVLQIYNHIKSVFPNAEVIIGETGFPSQGQRRGAAVPTPENQLQFYRGFTGIAAKNSIPYFYFDVFDEGWKIGEDAAGAHWGVYNADGSLKTGYAGLLPSGFNRVPSRATPVTVQAPLIVFGDGSSDNAFQPTGYMGDFVNITPDPIDRNWKTNPQSGDSCVKIDYAPGPKGWAGVYWQYPINNWGEYPGYILGGASKLTFWARGETGGEKAEFKVGGIGTGSYPDSINPPVSTGKLNLTSDWRQYTISLKGEDFGNLIGGFAFVADSEDNPGGAIVYLDNIKFE